MATGLYFLVKYFSFSFTIHLSYSDILLYGHNFFFSLFDYRRTDFDSILSSVDIIMQACIININFSDKT